MSSASAVELRNVSVERDGRRIVDRVSWTVRSGERWVVLGPNGSGKTTLLRILSAQLHPTSGDAWILNKQLGHVDVRELRKSVGIVSGSVIRSLRTNISVFDAVLSGRRSALEIWWDEYTDADRDAAMIALEANGVAHLAHHAFNVISEGERQKVLLARAMVAQPGLLLLDEPFAGLDLGARERLLVRLRALFSDSMTPPVVLVTHHTEEIPPEATHALLLRDGAVISSGAIEDALTSHRASEAFHLQISVRRDISGRWSSTVA